MTTIPATPADAHDDHHGDGHGHGQYPFLAHHFDTPAQQFDSSKLGMWLFLATEVLFFGGLFVWYAVLRALHPEIFSFASQYLNTLLGGINTCVLILSSLTMALGVRFAQTNKKRALVVCLVLTWFGEVGFLVIKYFEYSHKIHSHLLWGKEFYVPVEHGHSVEHADKHAERPLAVFAMPASDGAPAAAPAPVAPPSGAPAAAPSNTASTAPGVPAVDGSAIAPAAAGPTNVRADIDVLPELELVHGPHTPFEPHLESPKLPPNTHLFFAVYFCMTGLHAVHVIVGMGVIGWLIVRSMRGEFDSQYYTPVDLGGLYWHIVDLIWIFLFPLFYIIH